MRKPKEIFLGEFNYPLPDERIARYPVPERDRSKLLIFKNKTIQTEEFKALPDLLNKPTHLVFNNTKVIHARLFFRKTTGAQIEIFCLEPIHPFDYQVNFSEFGSVTWKCIVGNSRKWKNEILKAESIDGQIIINAERIKKDRGNEAIRFSWQPENISFSEVLEIFGKTPIPPYLNRDSEESDSLSYQTIYSKHEGSVAAPTAGLHFTEPLLNRIRQNGIPVTEVTLHVGAGTFVPVKVENGLDHEMHTERFQISKGSLLKLIDNHKHITTVGTTSTRTLESLYWMGVKILTQQPAEDCQKLGQFESYGFDFSATREEALLSILAFMEKQKMDIFFGSTSIMISPGYDFMMTDSLITNFHQPSSTLLMLIAAFVGDEWKRIYTYALENDFRFLSYGDSSILFRE
ncbi:MAG: S-adenosylmethionine:tRNA ribosyltransferase-isomerase [Bacteroidales bacterium]|nr:S-adenosylmethionine:tRNA ribosyltransferase-isomerase [Bacteroidales bacterium]